MMGRENACHDLASGHMLEILRQSIDLLAWVEEFGQQNPYNP